MYFLQLLDGVKCGLAVNSGVATICR